MDRIGPALFGLGACLWLSACASQDGPGWANPLAWFSEDEVAFETLANDKELSKDYPTLGAVPESAPPVSTAEQRALLARDLQRDRSAARYSGSGSARSAGDGGPHVAGSQAPAPYPAGLSTANPVAANLPVEDSDGERIAVIYFQHGSSRLADDDRAVLADVAAIQLQRQGRLHVVGHASSRAEQTDPVASRLANFAASIRRANAVAAELMRQGVAAEWLEVSAHGSDAPTRSEDSAVGEASNRRAEIFLEM